MGGGLRDENTGVASEDEFSHIFSEPKLSEHLGLEVEDLSRVIKQEEGMVQQDLP